MTNDRTGSRQAAKENFLQNALASGGYRLDQPYREPDQTLSVGARSHGDCPLYETLHALRAAARHERSYPLCGLGAMDKQHAEVVAGRGEKC
jgi:hypothetical protein